MKPKITRNNHYVPQWYQRGFLAAAQTKLHVLDLSPGRRTFPNGRTVVDPPLNTSSPKGIFCELDLYTTRFGEALNDEIERFLFGAIDNNGALAVRAFAGGDQRAMHEYFQAFFEYLDAQKLRTPKGLDWISSRYAGMSQLDLMVEMQSLRQMHCTMWTECAREIVSAEKSPVKFLVSDHPVTIYHREYPPDATECRYPQDPGIDLIGSQTVFALDANHCLILTNLEYAEDPGRADVMAARTHARYRGRSLVRTDAFIRSRDLAGDQVTAVNHLLKSRARRYVAAGTADWLHPERSLTLGWREIGELLLPRQDLWNFGGEIYVGYKDGSTHYQDQFGRTSRVHRFLRKEPRASEPGPQDLCGCGSGHEYQNCCCNIAVHERPPWTTYSIRERNLILCRGVDRILGLSEGKTWDAVRRELSDDQVREIHDLYAALWPVDTQLSDLLPRPRPTALRALFMGVLDPRTLPLNATGWLPYFDELVLAHPFLNSATIKPEYSPSASPGGFKEQTLRNVYVLMMLEPYVAAGRIHLVPDPADFDDAYRKEAWAMAERRKARVEFSAEDRRIIDSLSADDHLRWIKRLPDDALRSYIRRNMPEIAAADLQGVIEIWKRELEEDPFALLQPVVSGEAGAQVRTVKGFNLETGMFLASLTGSILYADMHATWDQLHEPDVTQQVEPAPEWQSSLARLADVAFPLALEEESGAQLSTVATLREFLHTLVAGVKDGQLSTASRVQEQTEQILRLRVGHLVEKSSLTTVVARLEASVPAGGFRRKDVTRLLLTFGRAKQVQPVPLAFLMHWNRVPSPDGDPRGQI